jgi:hypothetical protein
MFPNKGGAALKASEGPSRRQNDGTHYAEDGFVNDSESKPQSQKL